MAADLGGAFTADEGEYEMGTVGLGTDSEGDRTVLKSGSPALQRPKGARP